MDGNSRRELRSCYGDKRVHESSPVELRFWRDKGVPYVLTEANTPLPSLIIIIFKQTDIGAILST